jgi:hypothetical protein
MAFKLDFSKLGEVPPENACPVDGCGHSIKHVGFTPRHRWNLNCRSGGWWEGCRDATMPEGPGYPPRCECPGCRPRQTSYTRRLTLNMTKPCRCARDHPELARTEAEYRTERQEQQDEQ